MVGSLLLGSILVLAIIIRYVYSRRQFSNIQGSSTLATSSTTTRTKQPATAKLKVDKTLLLRFTIAFLLISAFEAAIFAIEFQRKTSAATLAQQDHPDFDTSSTIDDILGFMPGVTIGLLAFLIFGTTAQFRKRYVEAFRSARVGRRRRPSLPRPNGPLEVWDTLGSTDVMSGGYSWTIRAGPNVSVPNDIEMQTSETVGKTRPGVRVQDEKEINLPIQSNRG